MVNGVMYAESGGVRGQMWKCRAQTCENDFHLITPNFYKNIEYGGQWHDEGFVCRGMMYNRVGSVCAKMLTYCAQTCKNDFLLITIKFCTNTDYRRRWGVASMYVSGAPRTDWPIAMDMNVQKR